MTLIQTQICKIYLMLFLGFSLKYFSSKSDTFELWILMETPPEQKQNRAKLLICTQLTRGSFLQTLYHVSPVCPAITARTDHYYGQWPQSSRNRNITKCCPKFWCLAIVWSMSWLLSQRRKISCETFQYSEWRYCHLEAYNACIESQNIESVICGGTPSKKESKFW